MPFQRILTGSAIFEAHFPYEETDDQLRCVQEIKHDMEQETPMERLLCGDVGFGKTEVALRAAFKCTGFQAVRDSLPDYHPCLAALSDRTGTDGGGSQSRWNCFPGFAPQNSRKKLSGN